MTALALRPLDRDAANMLVRRWHSHHKPVRRHRFAIGCLRGDDLCGAAIVGNPIAKGLQDGFTFEVLRLVTDRTRMAASKLLAASWRCARSMGVRRMVSYLREDEIGTCYRAVGWRQVADVNGREWTSGHASQRWLPGLYEPSTEIVDRVRWEVAA